jgi:hypothetical protein
MSTDRLFTYLATPIRNRNSAMVQSASHLAITSSTQNPHISAPFVLLLVCCQQWVTNNNQAHGVVSQTVTYKEAVTQSVSYTNTNTVRTWPTAWGVCMGSLQ